MGVVDLDDVVVFLRVVLILDVSDDFLNEILNGNKSYADSVLIEHYGHGIGIRLHGVQKIIGLLIFIYIQWLSHDVTNAEIIDIMGCLVEEEILNMKDTDHVISGVLIYRNSRIRYFHVELQQIIISHINRGDGHICSWDHDIPCNGISEVHHIGYHFLLFVLDDAFLLTDVHHAYEFILGHLLVPAVLVEPYDPEYKISDLIHYEYHRCEHYHKELDYVNV